MPSGVFFRSALINLSFLQAPQLEPSHVWSTGPLQPSLWSVARHQGQDIETAERHMAPEAPSRWAWKNGMDGCQVAWTFPGVEWKFKSCQCQCLLFFQGFCAKDELWQGRRWDEDMISTFISPTLYIYTDSDDVCFRYKALLSPLHSAHSFAIVASQAATTVFIAQRTICWMPPFSSSSSCRRLSGSLCWMWIFLIRLAHVTHT